MTSRDPLITSARIVTPEEAALDSAELATMKIMLAVARRAGKPLNFVQFSDGVAIAVQVNPDEGELWYQTLAQAHQAAIRGSIGPIQIKEKQP